MNVSIKGFTLIELLASMTIIVIMVMLITAITTGAVNSFDKGTSSSDLNIANRAISDYLRNEISSAFAYSPATSAVMVVLYNDEVCPYNYSNAPAVSRTFDKICFARLDGEIPESTGDREIAVRTFYIKEYIFTNAIGKTYSSYALMRGKSSSPNNAKAFLEGQSVSAWTSFLQNRAMIENVTSFSITPYDETGSPLGSSLTELPAFVDICIGLVTEEDLKKMSMMDLAAKGEYLNSAEQFVATRVGINNRTGNTLDY